MYSHMLPRDPNMLGGEVAMWSEYVDAQALGKLKLNRLPFLFIRTFEKDTNYSNIIC